MAGEDAVLRVATPEDGAAIDALMKSSVAAIFPRSCDDRQTESAMRYVADVDRTPIADGTSFVLESGGKIVGCGGWSRRDLPFTGSGDSTDDGRLLDPASQPARVRAMDEPIEV